MRDARHADTRAGVGHHRWPGQTEARQRSLPPISLNPSSYQPKPFLLSAPRSLPSSGAPADTRVHACNACTHACAHTRTPHLGTRRLSDSSVVCCDVGEEAQEVMEMMRAEGAFGGVRSFSSLPSLSRSFSSSPSSCSSLLLFLSPPRPLALSPSLPLFLSPSLPLFLSMSSF